MTTHRFTRAATAVALVGLASLALGGCQQESRYCDDTGCYFCDGLGCRTVNPPIRPSCTCDYQCGAGTDCTSLGCTTACTTDAQCTDGGTRCTGGFCVGPREAALTQVTCDCTTTADCHDPHTICITAPGATIGQCMPGCSSSADDCDADQTCVDGGCQATVHPTCGPTNPCAAGLECVNGECRSEPERCTFNSECGAGRVCVNRECDVACTATTTCPGGSECLDGYCRSNPMPLGPCTTNADCPGSTDVCIDQSCYRGCGTDADCPGGVGGGEFCDPELHVCRYDWRPRPTCDAMNPCRMGSVCHNGSCRSPCAADAECPLFDVQFHFCVMNVCETTNEATSNCMGPSDCMTGQDCVDGICM